MDTILVIIFSALIGVAVGFFVFYLYFHKKNERDFYELDDLRVKYKGQTEQLEGVQMQMGQQVQELEALRVRNNTLNEEIHRLREVSEQQKERIVELEGTLQEKTLNEKAALDSLQRAYEGRRIGPELREVREPGSVRKEPETIREFGTPPKRTTFER